MEKETRKKKTRKKRGGRKCPPSIETIKGPEVDEGHWYFFQPDFYKDTKLSGRVFSIDTVGIF